MKKLYTLALAALTAASAMAINPAPRMQNFTDLNVKGDKLGDVKTMDVARATAKRAVAKADESALDLSGIYVTGFTSAFDGVSTTAGVSRIVADTTATTPDAYLLKNYWYPGYAKDIPCTVQQVEFQGQNGPVPYDCFCLQGKYPIITQNGDYTLWLTDFDANGNPVHYEDDIPFIIFNGGDFMINPMVQVIKTPSGKYLDAAYNCFLAKPNGYSLVYEFNDEIGDFDTEKTVYYAYSEASEDYSEVVTYLAFGYPTAVTFTVDEEGNASAVGAVAATVYDSKTKKDIPYIYMNTEDPENMTAELTGKVVNLEQGGSALMITHEWAISPNGTGAQLEGGGKDTYIYFDFQFPNLPGYGENSVANVGVDANAPVEFYNLQGVRVQNPENGLFIRRQGNKATKVIK